MRGDFFNTTVSKTELLSKLQENREQHKVIYRESLAGFVSDAERQFKRKLADLSEGRLKNLSVRLEPPQDHTAEYDTAIAMLEWHQADQVELNGEQFRQFVMDEWDWMQAWLFSNRRYSSSATEMAAAKYGAVE